MPHKNLLLNFKRPSARSISYEIAEDNPQYGKISAYPFERGYGTTVANSLRRTLLSSLPGYAISGMSIKYYDENGEFKILTSEFENIYGVYEDTIEIVQNLKKVRLALLDESTERKLFLELKGPRTLTAKDLEIDANIQVFNPDQHIATLNDKAFFTVEITTTFGRGYVPAEVVQESNNEVGFIAIDALYSPVERVTFQVDNYRIEQRTDYEKFDISVWTDGSITPVDAIADASKILKEHFTTFINFDESLYEESEYEEKEEEVSPEDENFLKVLLTPIEELELNARASNCLSSANIQFIGELVIKSEEELAKIKNLGQKSLEEIKEKLQQFDVELGMDIDKKFIEKINEEKQLESEEEEGEEE
jgi:DNA-directed RNA polymerase subunit alpha